MCSTIRSNGSSIKNATMRGFNILAVVIIIKRYNLLNIVIVEKASDVRDEFVKLVYVLYCGGFEEDIIQV